MTYVTYAILAAFFASLVAIFGKVGIRGVDSNLAVAIRTVIIVFFAWGIVLAQGTVHQLTKISRFSYIFIILSAIATGLSWLFYFKALQRGKVSQVAPVDKLSVALAILLSVIFLGEQLTWKAAIGAILIIGGTFVLII